MNLKYLRKRLGEIQAEAKAIVDGADANAGGALTDEQSTKFDALMSERETVEANIKRLDALDSMSATAGRYTEPTTPADPEPVIRGGRPMLEEDPWGGFKSVAEFARAVKGAGLRGQFADERLLILGAPSSTRQQEFGSEDGYMVPPAIVDKLSDLVAGDESLLAKMKPEMTMGNQIEVVDDETVPWGSTGVQAYWGSEAGQMTASKSVVTPKLMALHKLYAYVQATDELLEDAPRLEQRLTVKSAAAINWKADDAIVNGTGSGQPLGFLNAGGLVSVAKVGSQSADTVVAANVLSMRSALLGNGAGAFWLVHSTVIPQLGTMTVGQQPVWLPNGSIQGAAMGTLLGLPVYVSEHCQIVGDKGDIYLVQPAGYLSAIKAGGIKGAVSMHLFFDYGVTAFRWTFRMAGQPRLSAGITQANGSGTLGHIIALDARA